MLRNFKRAKRLMLMGFSVFAAVMAAQPVQDPAQAAWTFGLANGRAWRVMPQGAKLFYLEGVRAAIVVAGQRTKHTPCEAYSDRLTDAYSVEGLKGGEVAEAIDRFYDQPENLLIAAIDALEIVSARARGVPQNVIDSRISDHRRIAIAAPEHK
jgi:hypothetical protein